MTFWRGVAWGAGAVAGLGAAGALFMVRPLINRVAGGMSARMMGDGKYDENLAEMMTTAVGRHPRVLLETALRAERGKTISRPMYTTKKFLHFDDLMFVPAQLAKLPTGENERIDLTTVIGPKAAKPMKLELPVYVSGMAYGLSLTGAAKIALARGTAEVGTATNSGEGGFYEEERAHAKHYMLQYTRGGWPSDPAKLSRADAIEIQAGQGAQAGSPQSTPYHKLNAEMRKAMELSPGQDATMHSTFPGVEAPADFRYLVAGIRSQSGGIPVGIKIAAGHDLEADIEVALEAGVDFITVDGAQGSSHAAAPILMDDFGIPSLIAISRAARVLRGTDVSLIVSGGFMTPGEMLKALALGATAVACGAAPIMAAVHAQWKKIAPFEPPTALVWHDGKHRHRFNVDEGARDVGNWFKAVADELVLGVRSVGKVNVHAVTHEDLCALTPEAARVTGLPLAWDAPLRRPEGPRPVMEPPEHPAHLEWNDWTPSPPPDPVH